MTTPILKLRKHAVAQRDEAHDLDEQRSTAQREGLRPLSRLEIERRIAWLTGDVASALHMETVVPREAVAPRARWVSARDFVERMRPFLVYN